MAEFWKGGQNWGRKIVDFNDDNIVEVNLKKVMLFKSETLKT